MKTKLENNVTNHTGACGLRKNEIELSWSIGPGAVCDKNQAEQRPNRS